MGHWQLLQLEPEADERSIKRAYARLLKIHRPDEDAAAFQRLREAYDAALQEARWRADVYAQEPIESAPSPALTPAPEVAPQMAPTLEPLATPAPTVPPRQPSPTQVNPAPFEFISSASAPDVSLAQMREWLAEGHERPVFEALQLWLASDWLLPFDRRQQFEQDVLEWLEGAPRWSPAFFERVSQAMGWDEERGDLPCNYWRWGALIRRCEAAAWADTLQRELQQDPPKQAREWAAAFLLKPMSDARRRAMADRFKAEDWQACEALSDALAYQYPEVAQHLGMPLLENWRDWQSAPLNNAIYFYLWLAIALVMACANVLAPTGDKPGDLGATLVVDSVVMVPLLLFAGTALHWLWRQLAIKMSRLDIWLTRKMLPQHWYCQGTRLLVLRHLLPCWVLADFAADRTAVVPGFYWPTFALIFAGGALLTRLSQRGQVPVPWARPTYAAAAWLRKAAGGKDELKERARIGFFLLMIVLYIVGKMLGH